VNQPAGPALLFCPADRPDRFAKAAAAADVVILDLEDGVAPADKPAARQHLRDSRLDPGRTVIRLNPAGTDDHAQDLAALTETGYHTVMLAKTEHAADVRRLAPLAVIALCESALGVLNSPEIAAEASTRALMWGAEDLIVSLGGRSSRHADGPYRDIARQARSRVLLAAGAFQKMAIDAVYLDLNDAEGLRAESEDAAASGFAAKACIHPRQIEIVRAGFAPSADEVATAERVLKAAEGAAGVFAFEGRMVDEPLLAQARRIMHAAGRRVSPSKSP
jgi:citrate lyase subunit beta/citryl-CoA lyase